MIEINPLFISPSRLTLQKDTDLSDPESILRIVKDEILKGEVLESYPGGALILIKGKKVLARTNVPLQRGTSLSLKVEERWPVPLLKILSGDARGPANPNIPSILSHIKGNLWRGLLEGIHTQGLPGKDVALLKTLMGDLTQNIFSKSCPDLLKVLIDQCGVNWETKLRKGLIEQRLGEAHFSRMMEGDLKGLVSRFLALKEADGGLLNQFVTAIKDIQLLNCQGLEQEGKIFLPIPMQFPDGFFAVGQLLLQMSEREGDGPGGRKRNKDLFRVTFLLELSHIGPLRADLHIKDKEIEGRFLVTKEAAKRMIDSNIASFIEHLEAKGFSVLHMGCSIKTRKTVMESPLEDMLQDEGHNFSLVA